MISLTIFPVILLTEPKFELVPEEAIPVIVPVPVVVDVVAPIEKFLTKLLVKFKVNALALFEIPVTDPEVIVVLARETVFFRMFTILLNPANVAPILLLMPK